MANFLTYSALVYMLPCVADAVICVVDDNGGTYPGCKYCGFANVTTKFLDTAPSSTIQYACLPTPRLIANGYSTTDVNKCNHTTDSQPDVYRDIKLNLCNQDMCNTGCVNTSGPARGTTGNPGDAACVGLGFSTLISVSLFSLFTKV